MKKGLKRVTVLSDTFFDCKKGKLSVTARGSNILLFNVIDYLQKERGTKFEIYQLGNQDLNLVYKDIEVHILKSKGFKDYKERVVGESFKGDIVHLNNIDLFDGRVGKPLTATIHTNAFLEKNSAYFWLKSNLHNFDKIVVINSEYLRRFKDYHSNISYIKNGIPLDYFHFSPKQIPQKGNCIPIFFPNLDSPKKNRKFAVDLVKKLNQGSDYKFMLVLTGKEENLGIDKGSYEFVGEVKWGLDMSSLYKKAVFTIVPSISESCSLCSLESMACGTVVLANHIYGISDYISNKETSFLISTREIDKWISTINNLLKNPEEYRRISTKASKIVEKEYNSTRMANQYYEMWCNILNKNNGKR